MAESRYAVTAGIGYSDNVTLVEQGKKDETLASVGLDLSLKQRTRRLSSYLGVDASYVDYLNNTYDREVVGTAVGNFNLALVPERFEWYLNDNFGQTTTNRLAAETPENREYLNVVSTGPKFTIRLGNMNRVELTGEYARIDYEDSPFDNDTLGGAVAFVHLMSEQSSVSARVRQASTKYADQPSTADYDRSEATVGYQFDGARLSMVLEGGGVQIERDNSDKQKGSTFLVRVLRKTSEASSIELSLGRDIGDTKDMFVEDQSVAPAGGTSDVIPTSDPVTSKYAKLSWGLYRNRTGMSAAASYSQDRYENQTAFDRDRTELEARLHRMLSGRMDASLTASYRNEKFTESSTGFDEWGTRVDVTMRVGVQASVGLEYQHIDRNADDANAQGFAENRVWLRFFYGSRGSSAEQFVPGY